MKYTVKIMLTDERGNSAIAQSGDSHESFEHCPFAEILNMLRSELEKHVAESPVSEPSNDEIDSMLRRMESQFGNGNGQVN